MAPPFLPYLLGTARIDVTPPIGTHLAGYAARLDPSNGVYHSLSCSITVLTDPRVDNTLIIVSIEWLGFYENTDQVRGIIQKATGVPGDQVLLCGTHTHCGPPVRSSVDSKRHGGLDQAYLDKVFAGIGRAAARAMDSRQPASLRSAQGWCGFAHSRRRPDGKGGVEWMPTLDAPHDHTVPMLIFEDESGKPLHILFGYACHPTSAGPILEIGGDYVGFAMDRLQEEFGATASFLPGCAGDQKPYRTDPENPAFPQYPIEVIREFGHQLADAVTREIRYGQPQIVTGSLAISGRKLTLFSELQPREVYQTASETSEEAIRNWGKANLAVLDSGRSPDPRHSFEIQTIHFGEDLALVAMSGEMSVEYGLRLTRQYGRRFDRVWPVGYANHIIGYVPVARQYSEGGYEVNGSMKHLLWPGPLASDSEEQVFAAIEGLLG